MLRIVSGFFPGVRNHSAEVCWLYLLALTSEFTFYRGVERDGESRQLLEIVLNL